MRVKVNAETAREVLYAGGVVWHEGGVFRGRQTTWTWIKFEGLWQDDPDFPDESSSSSTDTLDDVLTWTDCEIEVPNERIVTRKSRANESAGQNEATPRRGKSKRRKAGVSTGE